jgi:probable F420-dependent oxidoreductase
MHVGLTMFPTDYSIPPHELAAAAEARGYESLWLPEHSHIPTSRKSPWPGGAELPKYYYDTYDPFLSLAAAAAVTKTIKLATGICLVVERDPIHIAKEVSTVDRLSSGRIIFGVGGGWNEEEMANHGTAFATRFKLMRERIEAMKQIWTQSTAAFDGELVKFEPMMQWPKPIQKPHPPIIVGGCIPSRSKTGDRLRRRLDSDRWPIRRSSRGTAAIPSNGKGRRPRSRVALLRRLRRAPRPGGVKALP